jgi:CheY-like chemotaxis protein
MENIKYRLLLADDDIDDVVFFKEALEELPFTSRLTTVNDGVELMQCLTKELIELPDMLFLDLNMPRKTGYECLSEIKSNDKLKHLPVVIISTSFERDIAHVLYKNGADFYLCKPGEFMVLKQLIHTAIELVTNLPTKPRSERRFVVSIQQPYSFLS